MSLERRISRRRFLEVALGFSVAAVAEPYLVAGENAGRVIGSLLGNGVDCTNNKESQNPQYPADAIAVPSGGIKWTDNGSCELKEDSKTRLEAAAIAYLNRLAPLIVLLGVEKSPTDENLSKVYLQQAFSRLTENKRSIPEEAIVMENNSINTATNMREFSEIAEEREIKKVLIVTSSFHEDRATLLACANNVAAYSVSAEELVTSQSLDTPWLTRIKEAFEKLTMLWDSKGEAQTLLSGMTR